MKAASMLYRERMSQANKEAKVTLLGVAIVIVCWLLFGFGLYGVDIKIFSTPLWIVMFGYVDRSNDRKHHPGYEGDRRLPARRR